MKLLYPDFDIPHLISNTGKPVGGAAVEWYAWIRAFRMLGCEFGLLTWEGAKKIVEGNYDFDFVESFHEEKGIPKLRRFTYRIPKLFQASRKYKPDFIIQECADEFTGIMAFIAMILRKPFIHRIASDMDVDGRAKDTFSTFTHLSYKWGIKRASHISCQNKYQYGILKERYPDKSISILYNPYFYKENTFTNQTEKEYIAWVGNFRFVKNLPALANIAESLPQYKFKIAGTKLKIPNVDTNNGLAKLQKLKNVEFVGHISNESIPEFLSRAYCLLNTSRLEGFSNTFLEAWAAGTPVISTKNVNPDSLITDYNLGIVVDEYEELPDVLDNIIKTKKYLEYGERCKDYVRTNHDPLTLAKRFLQEMKDSVK